jgi:hypothetical protein
LTTEDYSRIWAELDRQVEFESEPAMVLRLLVSSPDGELHLGVSTPGHLRHLLVRMPDTWDEDISRMPRWRGARILTRRGGERPTSHRFLVIEQGDASPMDVFEVLVGDVCQAVSQRAPGVSLEGVVTDRLARWKAFFDEGRFAGLGPEAQQGLFGELWFLREVVAKCAGLPASVRAWTGGSRTTHDFQFPNHAFEIKTSTAKQHVKVYIASERQLDTTGLETLHLVVLGFNVIQGGGETLPELVTSIRSRFAPGEPASGVFEDKLLEAGYIAVHVGHYVTGYVFRSERTYAVGEGFPRLLERDLPPGTGDLSYSIVLSSCEPFLRKLDGTLRAVIPPGNSGGP